MSRPAPRPLTPQRQREVAENRAKFMALMPEALPIMQQLLADGLIEGWRDLEFIGTTEEYAARRAKERGGRLTSTQFLKLGKLRGNINVDS